MSQQLEQKALNIEKDHDEQCVDMAKQLITSGFMEEEFACYGSAYIENGERKYYISTTNYSIKQFVASCLKQNIYPSVPKYFVKRSNVTPGSKDTMRQLFKKEVALKLSRQYPEEYFQAMEAMGKYSNDNAAMDLLFGIKNEIDSTFDKTALEIFSELVTEALMSRHLTEESYRYWQDWIAKEHQKVAEEISEWNHYQRMYSGYGVMEEGRIRYRKDGMEAMTIERRNKDMSEGKMVTPVLRKQYFASSDSELSKSAKEFKVLMETYLNMGLFEIEKQLRNLAPVVPKAEYAEWLNKIEMTGSQEAIANFKYYGYVWGVL